MMSIMFWERRRKLTKRARREAIQSLSPYFTDLSKYFKPVDKAKYGRLHVRKPVHQQRTALNNEPDLNQ
jgi:hypothetical protein